jgi:hypothetical protein
VGVLLMMHTQRIRMFGLAPRALMERYVETESARLVAGASARAGAMGA